MKDSVEKTKRKMKARLSDYKAVFGSKQGQRVLHDLMDMHGVIRSTFDKDPMMSAFKEGERNVVLRILSLIKTDPEKLIAHLEEIQRNVDE